MGIPTYNKAFESVHKIQYKGYYFEVKTCRVYAGTKAHFELFLLLPKVKIKDKFSSSIGLESKLEKLIKQSKHHKL